MNKTYSIRIKEGLLSLEQPVVMGIINITPDSFYTSCRSLGETEVMAAVDKAMENGAAIIDIGGYSTRPGAPDVPTEEELRRVSNALNWIRKRYPDVPVSVDTFRANVATAAVNEGADIINDISGGTLDGDMFATIARLQVPYILMHMRGTPATMQQHTDYEDVTSSVLDFFQSRLRLLAQAGVNDVILDPGFGFAKTVDQNYELLGKLAYFQTLNHPVLAGLSHKSMLYKLLGTTPQEVLNATTAANTIALLNGAHILRVHEVKEAVEAIKIVEQIKPYRSSWDFK